MTHSKTLVLTTGLLLGALVVSSGCGWSNAHARGLKMWETDHSLYRFKNYPFVPGNAVGQCPSGCDCPTHFVEPPFFGYHDTCWRRWPEGWVPCPTEPLTEELIEVAPEPVEEGGSPAGEATPQPKPMPQEGSPESRVVSPPKAKPEQPSPKPETAKPPMVPPKKEKDGATEAPPAAGTKKSEPKAPPSSAPNQPPASEKPSTGPQDQSLPSVPSLFDRQSRREEAGHQPEVRSASQPPAHRATEFVVNATAIVDSPAPVHSPKLLTAKSRRLQQSLLDRMRVASKRQEKQTASVSVPTGSREVVAVPARAITPRTSSEAEKSTDGRPTARPISYQSTGAPATLPPIPAKRLDRPAAKPEVAIPPQTAPRTEPAIVVDAERLRRATTSK